MLSNLNNEKEVTHFSIVANEVVKDQDASDNGDDNACTSEDEEEDEEIE